MRRLRCVGCIFILTVKRGLFRSMVGFSVKQFDLVKNSTQRDKVLLASLNLARAKLFIGQHQDAAKMANYVRLNNCLFIYFSKH